MRPITPATLAAWIVIGLLAFGPPLNLPAIELPWNIGGQAAPFKATEPDVLVIEETEQRTPNIDAVCAAIEKATLAANGKFRRLDKDQSDLSKDEQWVQDAWRAKGSGVPWIIAADKRRGINQSLPTSSPADALKLLAPIGVK